MTMEAVLTLTGVVFAVTVIVSVGMFIHRQKESGRPRPHPIEILSWVCGIVSAVVALTQIFTGTGNSTTAPDASTNSATAEERQVGPTPLEVARSTCAPSAKSVRLGDDGYTLMIDRAVAKNNPGIDRDTLDCIFGDLDVPDSVISRVENTTPLSGLQEAEFNGFSATWTYHRDEGLNMTITMN